MKVLQKILYIFIRIHDSVLDVISKLARTHQDAYHLQDRTGP